MAFDFFDEQRVGRHLSEIKHLRYVNRIEIDEMIATDDDGSLPNPSPPLKKKHSYTLKRGDFWSGRDKYVWLGADVALTKSMEGKKIVGCFDFGKTGGGTNSGFESLLYINGAPYQGVDSNHNEVIIDTKKEGLDLRLDFRLWSGLRGGGMSGTIQHQIKEMFFAELNEAADDLYYTAWAVLEAVKELGENDEHKYSLRNLLVETMKIVDFTDRGERFYSSVKKAAEYINSCLDGMEKDSKITVNCVGHTHIDVAWLWRLKHTREKCARSFSTANRLMENYDEFTFLQTQAQLYEYIKEDFPEIYESIKTRVAQGKWEPSGGMWVEPDCNIPSGESLIRQILYGKRFFKQEFGCENTFLWLPDTFGFSWTMPQILKKSGIKTFITTKISWSEINKLPYDTFFWRGIDGSEVLAHCVSTPDPNSPWDAYLYNGVIDVPSIIGIWEKYSNKDLNRDLLISYGYGDGGGGANRDMVEMRRRIDKIPGVPHVKSSDATSYFERLHETVNDKENPGFRPVWDGELYLEFCRGTYTSQAYTKKMNRKLEFVYRDCELLNTLSAIKTGGFDKKAFSDMHEGWKIVLRNQFHDILPGSSIKEVYEDSKIEYSKADDIAREHIGSAIKCLTRKKDGWVTFINTSSFTFTGLSKLPEGSRLTGCYLGEDGQEHPVQESEGEGYVEIGGLPPLSALSLKHSDKKAEVENPFGVSENKIESKNLIISWDEKGHLTSIFHKGTNREVLTDKGNVIEIFEDKPRFFDAWEMESTIDYKKERVEELICAKMTETGPHFTKIHFKWKYNNSTIDQDMVVYPASDRVDFVTTVDWQEREKLMKVAFPVDVRSVTARYDIGSGSIERPTHWNTSWDFAKFEVLGHQWADLYEKGFGVAIINDCKYGYDIKGNRMRLSLLKASNMPDPTADKGVHTFTYSLYVHTKEWYASGLMQNAWQVNSSLHAVLGHRGEGMGYFQMLNEGYVIDAVKKTEDGSDIVLRLHETYGGKQEANIRLNFDHDGWFEADLMENRLGDAQKGDIRLKLCAYEIKTVIIKTNGL